MTKEELEKEAEEYAEQCYGWTNNDLALDVAKATYITSAEPREKEIKLLGERCLQLQGDKGRLTDRVRELEAQIEKMKQCGNCGNGTIGNCEHCKRKPKQKSTDTDDYWRLKEIKGK